MRSPFMTGFVGALVAVLVVGVLWGVWMMGWHLWQDHLLVHQVVDVVNRAVANAAAQHP